MDAINGIANRSESHHSTDAPFLEKDQRPCIDHYQNGNTELELRRLCSREPFDPYKCVGGCRSGRCDYREDTDSWVCTLDCARCDEEGSDKGKGGFNPIDLDMDRPTDLLQRGNGLEPMGK